jgi:superfamily II DNA/RNA helicase
MSFEKLGVHPALAQAMTDEGKTTAFPIQVATLPEAIAGRDILGRGQTGSGKTLAFGLAMMTRLAGRTARPHHPLGLVLAPTRELAVQISEVIAPLSRTVNLNSQVVAGGMPYMRQIQALKRGVPIIVATPGRLMDLLDKGHINLSDVEITVLDEADQMADMGFLPSVKEILALTKKDGQRLLFSATLDRDVDTLVKMFLKNPVTHSLENEKSTAGRMLHHILIMDQAHKDVISTQIAARDGRTIFFVRTKHGADKLAEKMLRAGVPVGVLHGGKSQGQRTRVLAAFKDGKTNALVATDVAARGIHVDGVSLVVHVDAPADHKDYLHRAGRTARAGESGTVVTLATSKQKKGIHGLASRAAVKLAEVFVKPHDPELIRVTGAQAPSGIPIEAEPEKHESSRKPGSRNRGDRGDRGDRPARNQDRPDYPKRERGPYKGNSGSNGGRSGFVKKDKPEPVAEFRNNERPVRNFERPQRNDRPARASDRPAARSWEQNERPARPARDDRSERPSSRPSTRPTSRSEARTTRDDRASRPARAERPDFDPRDRAPKKKWTPQEVRNSERPARDGDRPAKKSAAAKPFRTNKFDPMGTKPTDGFRAKSAAKKAGKKAAPKTSKPGRPGKPAVKKVAGKKKPRTK